MWRLVKKSLILSFFVFALVLNTPLVPLGTENTQTANAQASVPITLVLGAENTVYEGRTLGYTRTTGPYAYSYCYYYMYMYESGSSSYRGWAVFNLEDINSQYGATAITSGAILVRNEHRYYTSQLDFYALNTIPYNGSSSGVASDLYMVHEESGGSDSEHIATVSFPDQTNTDSNDLTIPLTPGGIDEINTRIANADYDFAIGGMISDLWPGNTYGYLRYTDVRLVLSFTIPGLPDTGEVAMGDELTGHIYQYTELLHRPEGFMYLRASESYEYRGYTTWGESILTGAIPAGSLVDKQLLITGVSVKLSRYQGSVQMLALNHMQTNPLVASVDTIWNDISDGPTYLSNPTDGDSSPLADYEWNLGSTAVAEIQNVFDGISDFFAIGVLASVIPMDYTYLYSPKLVIQWELIEPTSTSITSITEPIPLYQDAIQIFSLSLLIGAIVLRRLRRN